MTTYSFNINGLSIGNYSFCPKATCELLSNAGFIEAWEIDNNNEPVILYSKEREDGNGNWDTQTGCEYWCDFVKSFFINERVAALLLEFLSSAAILRTSINTINELLNAA